MALVFADVGLPMIAFQVPVMAIAFVPIVLVETFVIARSLDLRFGRTLRATALANLVSTIVGVPFAWFLMLFVDCAGAGRLGRESSSPENDLLFSIGNAAWMAPNSKSWMLGVAFFVLAIPAFFASVWVEWRILEPRLEGVAKPRAKKAVWLANVISYVGLVIVVSVLLML